MDNFDLKKYLVENKLTKNSQLPSYNPYSGNEQESELCPSCGETEDLQLLGPKDYKRDEHGNYRRTMGYQCGKCKSVFTVDKN